MLNRTNIYKSSDSLPIWNFDKIQTTNDLRYLLKLSDYEQLPRLNKWLNRKLIYNYGKILGQFKSKVLSKKQVVLKQISELVIDISKNSKDPEKIRKASIVLRALMIDTTKENLLWDVNFTETPGQRQMLTGLSVALKRFNEKLKSSVKKIELSTQKVRIETVLGVSIDVRKCTVSEFMAYSSEANTKINQANKYVN